QRRGRAGPGGVRECADESAVKKAVLLRERRAEISDDHAAAGRDLVDTSLEQAQEALTAESGLDALDIIRVAHPQRLGGRGRGWRFGCDAGHESKNLTVRKAQST